MDKELFNAGLISLLLIFGVIFLGIGIAFNGDLQIAIGEGLFVGGLVCGSLEYLKERENEK